MIRKLRRYLSIRVFTILLNAYVLSVIDYCLVIWGPSRKNDLDQLQRRIFSLMISFFYPNASKFYSKNYWKSHFDPNSGRSQSTECYAFFNNLDYNSLLQKCNCLTVPERLLYYSCNLVYKTVKYECASQEIINWFSVNGDEITRYSRRSEISCKIQVHKTKFYESSPLYYCSFHWNALPSHLKNIDIDFKVGISKFLIDKRDDVYLYY